jgi:hypothetical protein
MQFTEKAFDRLSHADQPGPARSPWRYGHGQTQSSMVSRYASQALALGEGLEGFGGGFSGICSPESVITSLAGFAALESVAATWVGVGVPRPPAH